MNIDSFLAHHRLKQNPFAAEEARLDPVFEQLRESGAQHPDFGKIMGRIDQPATAVVFGEKGSGKTAIRLEIERLANSHNKSSPSAKTFVVAYDDLNPVLDRLMRERRQDAETMLDHLRLEDHQDAILSLGVTRLVTALLEGESDLPLPDNPKRTLRRLPKETRRDFATLAMLYDTPASGAPTERLGALRRKLRLGRGVPLQGLFVAACLFTLLAVISGLVVRFMDPARLGDTRIWWIIGFVVTALAATGLWAGFLALTYRFWRRAKLIKKEMPATNRSREELRFMFTQLSKATLEGQPVPEASAARPDDDTAGDDRYRLTRKFLDVLKGLGYGGLLVLVDRMDEPTAIQGDADRMRRLVWPMMDNKFLKQDHVGLKLLLPVELSYLLGKESSDFYREARLDKQALVERLEWSGSTLYDLCSARLNAVRDRKHKGVESEAAGRMSLTDLFEDDVNREMLIDALDQMHQPRDAFKFMYEVVQEHCSLVPEEAASFEIARLTLETVRRNQSQRVQELYRGLKPA